MLKSIFIDTNQAQASLVEGPRLMTKQSLRSATVVIAVVGNYKSGPNAPHPSIRNDKFLALLSTEHHPQQPHRHDQEEADEHRENRREAESHLLDVREGFYCNRYLATLHDWSMSHSYRNPEHFCATDGQCVHGPAPSTFPGRRDWTFASGAATFDAAKGNGRRLDVDPVSPDVADYARALDELEDMLRSAVMAGLTDLEVVVSASDTAGLEPHDTNIVELEALISRALEKVVGWIEQGWVGREHVEVWWRSFGTTRNFGILGPRSAPVFMVYDEE